MFHFCVGRFFPKLRHNDRLQPKNYVGGLHTLHGPYPFAFASSNVIGIFDLLRYVHPSRWYFVPLAVI